MLGTTIIVTVIALTAGALRESAYEASTTVRLVTRASLSNEPVRSDDIEYVDRLSNTYSALLTGPALRTQVQETLELASRPSLRAEPRANTELTDIVAEARTPEAAVLIADTSADALIEQVRALSERDAQVSDELFAARIAELDAEIAADRRRLSQLRGDSNRLARLSLLESIDRKEATAAEQRAGFESNRLAAATRASTLGVVARAELPTDPAAPGLAVYGLLGFVLGLAGGIGLAFLVENLRPRLHTRAAVESASTLPVLAEIPTVPDTHGSLFNGSSGAETAFAFLRTDILASHEEGVAPTVLFTSAEPGEGTSTVVANLAKSIAASNRTVVVVDADLRQPVMHEIFGVTNDTGLASVLTRGTLRGDAIRSTHTTGLYVMPCDQFHGEPAAALGSTAMTKTLEGLRSRFDVVLIDTPALVLPDALTLARSAGAVVLVTRRGRVAPAELRRVRDRTTRVGARLLGVVLNGAKIPPQHRSYGQTSGDVEYV